MARPTSERSGWWLVAAAVVVVALGLHLARPAPVYVGFGCPGFGSHEDVKVTDHLGELAGCDRWEEHRFN